MYYYNDDACLVIGIYYRKKNVYNFAGILLKMYFIVIYVTHNIVGKHLPGKYIVFIEIGNVILIESSLATRILFQNDLSSLHIY